MGLTDDKKNVPRVLIVDDVETNRFVLRNIISDMGYMPILAENGMQALKLVERMQPQLILSDIAMPQMDGYEFCKIMKSDPLTRDIPIIFISAFDETEDVIRGFEYGGEDYITKPFIPEVVKVRVTLHLKLYDANKDLMETNRMLKTSVSEQLKQLEQEKKRVLYALLRVARENACYDEEHMERICYNCKILSQAMQLSNLYENSISDAYIETIELAAPLCDLGNVAIPTDILQKTSKLTENEIEVIKTHTTVGAKILEDVKAPGDYNDFIQMSIDIAKYHHENWDGTGYPNGLRGKEIPLAAQIVSVISEYCALTEDRNYRKAFEKENALKIIQEEAGVKFNPNVVDILKKIFRQLK